MKSFIHKIFIILVLQLTTACLNDGGCIEADDFGGFEYVSIKSNDVIKELRPMQVSNWVKVNGYVSGQRLIVSIDNQTRIFDSSWSPWYGISTIGNATAVSSASIAAPGSFASLFGPTVLSSIIPTTSTQTEFAMQLEQNNTACQYGQDFDITNPPCFVQSGVGLYMAAMPNAPKTLAQIEAPGSQGSTVAHLGQTTVSSSQGVIGYNNYPPSDWVGNVLYFRLLDGYYQDNVGRYNVTIKSGISKTKFDPFTFIIDKIRTVFMNTTKAVYNALIIQGPFVSLVRVLVLLYIVMYGLMFTMGMIRGNTGDLVIVGLKCGLVAILVSPDSWDFYNKMLFTLFTDGMLELAAIVSGTQGSPEGVFSEILSIVYNGAVISKVISIIFTLSGILFFVIYLIIIVFLTLAVIKAFCTYVLAIMVICIALALFPFFGIAILFKYTMNKFLNEWLRATAAAAIQAFIIISFYVFFRDILLSQFQKNLGFKICWVQVGPDIIPIHAWKPSISTNMANIQIPGTFYDTTSGSVCAPYQCSGYRYVDLPFLKPKDGNAPMNVIGNEFAVLTLDQAFAQMMGKDDQELIDYFIANKSPRFQDVMVLLGIVYCFMVLSAYSVTMAKFISSASNTFGGGGVAEAGEAMGGKVGGGLKAAGSTAIDVGGRKIGAGAYKVKEFGEEKVKPVAKEVAKGLGRKVKDLGSKAADKLRDEFKKW